MLSQEAIRKLETVDREQIELRVRAVFERWSAGDVEGVVSHIAPDVCFPAIGGWSGVRAPIRGRDAVTRHLRKYARALENIVTVLHEIVIDGDRVVAHRTSVGRWREDGRRYQCDFISFLRFRDGLIVEFSDYPDAAWREADRDL